MTDHTPNHLPILSTGKQAPGSGKVCAERLGQLVGVS
jgi:hypothetical protein